MKRWIRRIIFAAFALLALAAVVYAFLPQPVSVEVAEVDRGVLRVTVDEEGQTRVRERYIVSSPLTGRLERITFDAGDPIAMGETVLARVDPIEPALLDVRTRAQAEARVRAAEAALARTDALLERARAALAFAQQERERVQSAFERAGTTRRELDRALLEEQTAQQELRAAEFAVQVANFELAQAQAALLRTQPQEPDAAPQKPFVITSPITGVVLRVLQESAAVVQPGTPLVEVGDAAELEVVIDVLSTDAVQIEPGAPVLIERWGGTVPLAGVVRRVEPSAFTEISALGVEEQRVNVIVDFVGSPEAVARLGDGYRVEGRIVTWEQADVVQVPTAALFRVGSNWAVFVIEDGRAVIRPVQIGQQNGLMAQVLEGLQPSELIIAHPSDRVRQGARVTPVANGQ